MAADTNRWAFSTEGSVQADWVSVLDSGAMKQLSNRHRASKWDVLGIDKYTKPETVTTVVVRPRFRISNTFATGRVQFDAILMNYDVGDVTPWAISAKGFIIEASLSDIYKEKWSEIDLPFYGFPTQRQECFIWIVRRAIPWNDDGGSNLNPDVKLWVPRREFCPRDPSDAAHTPREGYGQEYGTIYGQRS
jgi:hypothetical protein